MKSYRMALAAVVGMMAGTAGRADGASIAITFSGGSLGGSAQTRGWSFSTDSDITVTSLGWFDSGADGLAASHQVGIWTTGGTLLMSATVAAGTADPILNNFRFNSALTGSPSLTAGTYVIGGLSTNSDQVAFLVPAGNVTLAPGIAFLQNRTNNNSGVFSFPGDSQSGLDVGVFGPSFQFDVVAPVPEASHVLPAALAALAAAGLIRRRSVTA
jgi:MYXO-CTERM domain-containing protein